jgi:hypothetical protein
MGPAVIVTTRDPRGLTPPGPCSRVQLAGRRPRLFPFGMLNEVD